MITLRFLVSNASVATDAFFAPVRGRDYGVLARFAWIGFDPRLERVAYHRRSGRAVIAGDVPILPPALFASAAVRSNSARLRVAINRAFARAGKAEREALNERSREPLDDAVHSVDIFHPVVITPSRLWSHDLKPLPFVRLERMHPANGREWIDVVHRDAADAHLDRWQRWYEKRLMRPCIPSGIDGEKSSAQERSSVAYTLENPRRSGPGSGWHLK